MESKQEKYIFIDVEEDKNKIAIYIKDSGGGIEEDIIDRIEEPYFSTKHPSSGTGMGLYMSYVLITKHMQGEIKMENKEFEYESRMYKGLLVTIELPKIKK